jgi:hypothetical protein
MVTRLRARIASKDVIAGAGRIDTTSKADLCWPNAVAAARKKAMDDFVRMYVLEILSGFRGVRRGLDVTRDYADYAAARGKTLGASFPE